MARKPENRRVDYFYIHGHTTEGPINYHNVFNKITEIQSEERNVRMENYVYSVSQIELAENIVWFVVYRCDEASAPLLYNTETGEERVPSLDSGEYPAEKTHVAIDLSRRLSIVEYKRGGAKAADIAVALMYLGRHFEGFETLNISFAPIIGDEFREAIDTFERIRQVGMRVSRPNQDWDDHEPELSSITKESNGSAFELYVNAVRGLSLNRDKGIVQIIKNLISRGHSSLQNAKITGRRVGESRETTVSSRRYHRHARVEMEVDQYGKVVDERAKRAFLRVLRNTDDTNL